MNIDIIVRNKIASLRKQNTFAVCGNSDYTITFFFDEEWKDHDPKTARFQYNGGYTDIVFEGSVCNMPIIENAHIVEIGVFAGNLHTTTAARLPLRKSILSDGGTPIDPTPSVYAQILELIESMGGDRNFIYRQDTAQATWEITHDLNKYPSVSIVDSTNNVVFGDIEYIDLNHVKIYFSGAFAGKAFLNCMGGGRNFIYRQDTAQATWEITHDLNKYPSVSIVDSANNAIVGNIEYIDLNHVKIYFSGAFAGKAFLN